MEDKNIILKVKTMDDQVFSVTPQIDCKVFELKELIQKETSIPVDKQRIVFSGRLLNDCDNLNTYSLENDNVLHLIAYMKESHIEAPPNQESTIDNNPITEENRSNLSDDEEINDEIAQEAIDRILRTLDHTSTSRRNQRRLHLQQRNSGFNVSDSESFEVIRQNMVTLKMLENCFTKLPEQESLSRLRIKGFNINNRKIEVGQWVDVKDTVDQWLEAEVISVQENSVYVHYNGWGRRWDEWIDMGSPRIAPFRTKTVNSAYSMFLSPNPSSPLDGDHTNMTKKELGIKEALSNASHFTDETHILLNDILKAYEFKEIASSKVKEYTELERKRKGAEEMKKKIKATIRNEIYRVELDDPDIQKIEQQHNEFEEEKLLQDEYSFASGKFIQEESLRRLEREIYMKSSQLAPYMDRVGRMLIDLAPHIAMLGTVQSMSMISGLPSSLAALLQEGSFLSERLENRINHIIGRAQSTNNDISSGSQTENNSLSSQGRSLSFEIPVMLNPGEILSVLPRTSDWISDGHVHLHLNADVYIPASSISPPNSKSTSTQTAQQGPAPLHPLIAQFRNPQFSGLEPEIEESSSYESFSDDQGDYYGDEWDLLYGSENLQNGDLSDAERISDIEEIRVASSSDLDEGNQEQT